nr:reverse transcriptase domain-containing protein [Tanacetum cinerariifolium]
MDRPASDAALREYCDRYYHQLLPIIAEKVHQENVQQEKLKAVKARLNFEELLQHSESGILSRMRDLIKRLGSRRVCSVSGSLEPKRGQRESPRKKDPEKKWCSKGWKIGYSTGWRQGKERTVEVKVKKQRSIIEDDDLSQPWVCEEIDPFTSRIRYFDLLEKTRMPSHVKTYDESEDPKHHLKIFQAAAKVERLGFYPVRFSSYVGIAHSTITGGLDTALDLNYFLGRLVDD